MTPEEIADLLDVARDPLNKYNSFANALLAEHERAERLAKENAEMAAAHKLRIASLSHEFAGMKRDAARWRAWRRHFAESWEETPERYDARADRLIAEQEAHDAE